MVESYLVYAGSGPPYMLYSPNLVAGEFCELRLNGDLRSSHSTSACVTSSLLWCRKSRRDRRKVPTRRCSRMISPMELVLRLAVAAVLGALVGLERERLEWAAGMRTHALVSLGSALFMVVSIF